MQTEIPKIEFVAKKEKVPAHFIVMESCLQKFIDHLQSNAIQVHPPAAYLSCSVEYFALYTQSEISEEKAEGAVSTFIS